MEDVFTHLDSLGFFNVLNTLFETLHLVSPLDDAAELTLHAPILHTTLRFGTRTARFPQYGRFWGRTTHTCGGEVGSLVPQQAARHSQMLSHSAFTLWVSLRIFLGQQHVRSAAGWPLATSPDEEDRNAGNTRRTSARRGLAAGLTGRSEPRHGYVKRILKPCDWLPTKVYRSIAADLRSDVYPSRVDIGTLLTVERRKPA